jgi:hypothetical protein
LCARRNDSDVRRTHRIVVVAGLTLCLVATLGAYGTLEPSPERGIYPDGPAVADDPGAYVGDRVLVSGPVVAREPTTIRLQSGAGERRRVTVDTTHDPAVGDSLTIFGVLRAGDRLDARDVFVVDESGLAYTYSVSTVAGLWVLGRLVRGWRLDDSLALVPRERPLRLRDLHENGGDERA